MDADANVQKYLKREAELNEAKAHVRRTEFIARNAEFMDKGLAKVAMSSKLRQQQRAQAEMQCLDAELLDARRTRLKYFYQAELARYQAELQARGLSLPC